MSYVRVSTSKDIAKDNRWKHKRYGQNSHTFEIGEAINN